MKKSIDIFSKDYQNYLKSRWEEGITEVWGTGSKMIPWEMKQITYIVPICGGKYMIELTKPSIETDFYFGESDCGQGPSYSENRKIMNKVELTLREYFLNKNLSGINKTISDLKDIIKGKSNITVKHFIHYYNSPENTPIHGITFYNPWYGCGVSGETYDLDIKDVKNILKAYELQKERFVTRLEAYLKKYGTTKLGIHSYWIDR